MHWAATSTSSSCGPRWWKLIALAFNLAAGAGQVDALTVHRARVDLATRADVEAFPRRFYGQVLVDDILAEPFSWEMWVNGLESHLPVMCDFWQTVLFRAGLYGGSAVRAHQPVHDRHVRTARHFLRWLKPLEQHHRPDVSGSSRRTRENRSDQNRRGDAPPANGTRLGGTRCSCPTANLTGDSAGAAKRSG